MASREEVFELEADVEIFVAELDDNYDDEAYYFTDDTGLVPRALRPITSNRGVALPRDMGRFHFRAQLSRRSARRASRPRATRTSARRARARRSTAATSSRAASDPEPAGVGRAREDTSIAEVWSLTSRVAARFVPFSATRTTRRAKSPTRPSTLTRSLTDGVEHACAQDRAFGDTAPATKLLAKCLPTSDACIGEAP